MIVKAGTIMVPHILILDQDKIAAQVTRSLVWHVLPGAHIYIVPPNMLLPDMYTEAPIDVLIIDPAGANEVRVQQLRVLQQRQPALVVVVLTSEPPARCIRQLHDVQVYALLEKGDSPAVLINHLRCLVHSFKAGELVLR